MASFADTAMTSSFSWLPGCAGDVARYGRQNDHGAAGVEELYVVRSAGRRARWGLVWHDCRTGIVTSLDRQTSEVGELCWPSGPSAHVAVTWFPSRGAAFAAARTI